MLGRARVCLGVGGAAAAGASKAGMFGRAGAAREWE